MTPKEQADTEFVNAQRDAIYLDREVISEVAAAKELVQEGVYTNITPEYILMLEGVEDDFDTDTDDLITEPESENEEGKEEKSSTSEDGQESGS